jgi:membrane protein DedA with SNARE-associated domain
MNIYYILYIFFESFILNSFPLFGAPFTLLSIPVLSIIGINIYNIILVSIILGIGAASGRLVIYIIGILLSKPLKNNKNLLFIKRISNSKNFYMTFFFLTILPFLPLDDLLFLSFGIEKINILKYYLITVLGKILKSFLELYAEIFILNKLSHISNIPLLQLSIISSIAFILLSIIFFKLDWEKYFNKWISKEK